MWLFGFRKCAMFCVVIIISESWKNLFRRALTIMVAISPSAEADSPSRPQYIVHPKQYILTPPSIIYCCKLYINQTFTQHTLIYSLWISLSFHIFISRINYIDISHFQFSLEVLKIVTDFVTISYVKNKSRVLMSPCCFSFEPLLHILY